MDFNRWKVWLEHKLLPKNNAGGYEPKSKEEIEKFKNADLITLPKDVPGTNCGNCKFFNDGYCEHREVMTDVTDRMCCKFWDNGGVHRVWGKEQA